MAAEKKREVEHKFLARIDNTPNGRKAGLWDRMTRYADAKGISKNDAVNLILEAGAKQMKL